MKGAKNQSSGWGWELFRFISSSVLALLLVFHCLSLDAVVVLLAYQWCLARWAGIDLPAVAYVCLGMGIWLGYTADRLKDISSKRYVMAATLRHHFHREHRRRLQVAWFLILLVALTLGWFQLPSRAFQSGLAMALAAAIYVFAVSRRKRTSREGPRLGKRFAVAILLSVSGFWWWLGWADPRWPALQLWVLGGVFVTLASWELIMLEGRRVQRGSFSSGWIRWGAAAVLVLMGWTLGMPAYACLLGSLLGFSVLGQVVLDWPGELKSLAGDCLILGQFLLLAWVA